MSQKELRRVEVLARVRSNQLRVVDASRLMGVSYRQAKRLWKRFREEGAAGLKHRSVGRASNRAFPPKFRQRVLALVREKYGGPVGERFGPTLAAEHLGAEDRLAVNAETLRLWMLEAGLWSRERKRRKYRRRRERREHFGELVQMDGSFHAWLEERGPEGCLIDMADDATNTTWAQLGEQETIWAVADALRTWIEKYGVPLAVWADVQQVGNRSDRGEFAASQGTNRADSRHAPRPVGEETATEAARHSRSGECVPAVGISSGTQPAVRPCGSEAGRLSPSGTAGCRDGSCFSVGERAGR
jgi:transposase